MPVAVAVAATRHSARRSRPPRRRVARRRRRRRRRTRPLMATTACCSRPTTTQRPERYFRIGKSKRTPSPSCCCSKQFILQLSILLYIYYIIFIYLYTFQIDCVWEKSCQQLLYNDIRNNKTHKILKNTDGGRGEERRGESKRNCHLLPLLFSLVYIFYFLLTKYYIFYYKEDILFSLFVLVVCSFQLYL